jgi:hypothetical protein
MASVFIIFGEAMKKGHKYYDEMDYDDELNDDEERAYRKEVHGSQSS